MSSILFDGKSEKVFWIIRFRELFARRSAICRGGIAVHFPRCRAAFLPKKGGSENGTAMRKCFIFSALIQPAVLRPFSAENEE